MQIPPFEVLFNTPASFTVRLTVPESLVYFKGHFPVQPLLPGVIQVGWTLELARILLCDSIRLKSISLLKFTSPILPADTLQIAVSLSAGHDRLDFTYQVELEDGLHPSSKGRIRCQEET